MQRDVVERCGDPLRAKISNERVPGVLCLSKQVEDVTIVRDVQRRHRPACATARFNICKRGLIFVPDRLSLQRNLMCLFQLRQQDRRGDFARHIRRTEVQPRVAINLLALK